jgi:hypothetical protein
MIHVQCSHVKQIPAKMSTLEVREMLREVEAPTTTALVLSTATAIVQVITADLTHLEATVTQSRQPSA